MVKKGRHRRFEEARALKRSDNFDVDAIFDNLNTESGSENAYKPEHDAWADLAAEYETDDPNTDESESDEQDTDEELA